MAAGWAPVLPCSPRRLGWAAGSAGMGRRDRYCELTGPPGRCASVLEFCLVLCTVSALTQSSLWLLNFALDSMVLPCPRMWPWPWPWPWVSGWGERPSREPPGCSLLRGSSFWGGCVGRWEGGRGEGSGGGRGLWGARP